MELVLAASDGTVDIEEAAEEALKEWMISFQGWGLLSSIVSTGTIRHVVLSLAYTSQHWDEEAGGEYEEEKVFNTVKQVYDNIEGKEFKGLLPKIGIWFEEIINGGEDDERKKNFTIFLSGKWSLDVKFVVEKKRVNRNLVELAAETVVRGIYSEEEIGNLEIPPELLDVVREKYRDAEWVRDFWRFQLELEGSEDEDAGDIHEELGLPISVTASEDGNVLPLEKELDLKKGNTGDIVSDSEQGDKYVEDEKFVNYNNDQVEGDIFSVWIFLSLAFLFCISFYGG